MTYPVCSVIRLRKFIRRGWVINAGQILKMMMQVSELDLTNPAVLQDQLTGVDSAYFIELMSKVKENDPEKVNAAYLVERSEEHTSEIQSLLRISYAVFCLTKQ